MSYKRYSLLISGRNRRLFIAFGLASVIISGFVCLQSKKAPCRRMSGEFKHDAYVWQRAWPQAVLESINFRSQSFSMLAVLGAEVTWQHGAPNTVRINIYYPSLRETGRPVGLVLRIGSFSGPFTADDERTRYLSELSKSLIREAEENSLDVAEMQMDFDCAESKLDGYRVWVENIRRTISPVPLVITALPSWLKHGEFRRLASAADGYVLQVHSLERPRDADSEFAICNPVAAKKYVELAARIGRPFRVALPTYGYLVAFDEKGKYAGASAEGPKPAWPENFRLRRMCSDPASMAKLIEDWIADRPELMQAIIWYRLPVQGDDLNWSWPTLRSVMSGKIPYFSLEAEARHPSPNLLEVDLKNIGEKDYYGPIDVKMSWSDARFIAGDGFKNVEIERACGNIIRFRGRTDEVKIDPGCRKTLGWVRLDKDVEVQFEIVSSK